MMNLSRFFASILAALLAALLAAPAAAQPRYSFEQTRTLLPKTVVPTRYDIALDLDPARDRFDGTATIQVKVEQALPAIVLHAHDLQARRVVLRQGRSARELRVTADAASRTWRLVPRDGQPIRAGAAALEIRYRGRVNAAGEGLYRARFRSGGKQAAMLATQLEAINARMVLPSFDEPVFRAAFNVEVTAPRGLEVLSNQPRTQRTALGKKVRHRFARTPSMPAYLFAVAVGRFDVLEGAAAGVPLRIFTAPGKRGQARLAMAATQQVLPYYNAYFGTPYALPKLDQLAVPGTRDGAMEDWGLISYVENALLFDPQRSTPETERGVFGIVAHEIAHQWFGNLVSVSSWDEIWLNEAFATWMQVKATERFHPEWQTRLSSRGWLDRTMARDATAATRAIRSGPVNEARVFDVFDGITYSKGGAVLSMLEQWVGEDAFQRGLAAYMRERRMSAATAGDLWHHIGQAVGQPVAAVAASWTDQVGLPLIDVSAACEGAHTVVTLKQQRFVLSPELSPEAGAKQDKAPLWQVPVRLARGDTLDTVLLDAPERRFELPGCSDAPLVANAGGRGFYRVRYSGELQARLREGFAALPAADRVALLADSDALAQAGVQPLSRHFEWLALLPRVTDAGRAPLYALAVSQLGRLEETFAGSPAAASIAAAGRALFAPELARIGWQVAANEDTGTTQLRARLIEALARMDDAATIAAARERFALAMSAQSAGAAPNAPARTGTARASPRPAAASAAPALPGSVGAAVIRAVGHHADAREFEALWTALRGADGEEQLVLFLDALGHTRDAARAQRLLDASLADWLAPNLAIDLPGRVAQWPANAEAAYAFTASRWPQLAERAGSGVFGARAWLLPSAQRLLADQQRLAGPNGAAPAAQIAAAIELRAAMREREAERLVATLAGWQPAR
jgi:aminopeptidase N